MGLYIDHVNTVLQKLRETPITSLSTDTTTEAYRAAEAVKRAVARVWNAKTWAFRGRITSVTTTASSELVSLPHYVGEPYLMLSANSPYYITPVRQDTFFKNIPNPVSEGNPQIVRLFEYDSVDLQPTSASTLSLASSSSADTTQQVLVKGLVSSEIDYELVSLSGTSTVTTTKSFSKIFAVTKSAETSGRVTITSNGAAVTNVVLAAKQKISRHKLMRLYPIPNSAIVITIHHYSLPPELTTEYEDTEIPPRWDYVVDQFAYSLALQAKGQTQLAEFTTQMQLADKFLNEDMVVEEYISTDEPIVPERFAGGSSGSLGWTSLPEGYGYTL